MEFMREFPDDAACLEHLWRTRHSEDGEHSYCPKCEQKRTFKRYATKQGRQSWTCIGCGHHVHPTAGTIFHGSSTSLHEDRVYVSGNVHTQTVEGFFGNLKNGIRGTYHSVSSNWLPSYLNEYAWRYNERSNNTRSMFETLVDRAAA